MEDDLWWMCDRWQLGQISRMLRFLWVSIIKPLSSLLSKSLQQMATRQQKTWCIKLGLSRFVTLKAKEYQTSLVVQWIRIHLLMKETRVQAVVQEDPTCHGATKPMRPNCWACALGLSSCGCWACVPQLLKLSVWSLCSATRDAAAVRSPHTATKSSPCSHN